MNQGRKILIEIEIFETTPREKNKSTRKKTSEHTEYQSCNRKKVRVGKGAVKILRQIGVKLKLTNTSLNLLILP